MGAESSSYTTETYQSEAEVEPIQKYPILMTGGAGATGELVARRFAREGFPLIIGTRSQDKFDVLSATIREESGEEVLPFVVNLTDQDAVVEAVDALRLGDQPIHLFALAAEGIRGSRMKMGRIILPLVKAQRNGELTRDMAEEATRKMGELVAQDEILQPGMSANYEGPKFLADRLSEGGNLRSGSRIVTLSSMLSHDTDPDNMDSYKGPKFYVPIGYSKAKGLLELQKIADKSGAGLIDFVAPEIEGTEVGEFLEGLKPLFQELQDGVPFVIPQVTREDVAGAMLREFVSNNGNNRTVFIDNGGVTSNTRPSSWDQANISYL